MDNCLTWVIKRLRYRRKGDNMSFRCSYWGRFPHFSIIYELENGNLVKQEYVPLSPTKRLLPPLFFKGKVITTVYVKVDQTTVMPDQVWADEATEQ